MNWQDLKLAESNTHFTYNGKQVFETKFLEALKFHAPGLAPVKTEMGWCHINTAGQPIYKQRYLRAFGYYCNRASVVDTDGWFHIDDTGKRITPEFFLWTGNFQENLCVVRNHNNKYFHVCLDGKRAYKEEYLYVGDFKDGYACVKILNGWKHINTEGKELNKNIYDDLGVFHKGIATAKDKNGWFHISKNGDSLYTKRYLFVEPFYNGIALVTNFGGRKELINELGEMILEIE